MQVGLHSWGPFSAPTWRHQAFNPQLLLTTWNFNPPCIWKQTSDCICMCFQAQLLCVSNSRKRGLSEQLFCLWKEPIPGSYRVVEFLGQKQYACQSSTLQLWQFLVDAGDEVWEPHGAGTSAWATCAADSAEGGAGSQYGCGMGKQIKKINQIWSVL